MSESYSPNLIEVPESVVVANAETQAERENNHRILSTEMAATALAAAQRINTTRPEGMSETLPTGEKPAEVTLGPSTVTSPRFQVRR